MRYAKVKGYKTKTNQAVRKVGALLLSLHHLGLRLRNSSSETKNIQGFEFYLLDRSTSDLLELLSVDGADEEEEKHQGLHFGSFSNTTSSLGGLCVTELTAGDHQQKK